MNELSNCPYCEGDFTIKEVECFCCKTQIRGKFKTNRFHLFSNNDLFFIEIFLKNEGNIKLMEKDLGVSYPTVKSRLKNIINILGYKEQHTESRTEILKNLADGKLDLKAAMKKLDELK